MIFHDSTFSSMPFHQLPSQLEASVGSLKLPTLDYHTWYWFPAAWQQPDTCKSHLTLIYYVVAVSNLFVITPKIGEDEPNLTLAYFFSNGLVKNRQLDIHLVKL